MDNKKKSKRIKPRLLRGFRDIMSSEMIARQKIIEAIKDVYELYGFVPIDTPSLEPLEVLIGGDYGNEGQKQIYRFKDFDDEDVALRFDLTVPLARFSAQYQELQRPFKRYQVGNVWRGDKPGPGRFREFIQFDVDIVGSNMLTADTEIISTACEAFDRLNLENYQIKIGSRKVLNLLLRYAEIDENMSHEVFRVIDKLDKQGLVPVIAELKEGRTDKSGDKIRGLHLSEDKVEKITTFLSLSSNDRINSLRDIKELFGKVEGIDEAVNELEKLDEYLNIYDIDSKKAIFDFRLARGLGYYTGIIFEGILTDLPEFGSIFGGGRYDSLVERFKGEKVPCTGAAIGVDRLLTALIKLKKLNTTPSTAKVLVTTMDKNLIPEYLKIAKELRNADIPVELYQGKPKGLKQQLTYADKLMIPIAIIMGSDEYENNKITIKDLFEGMKMSEDITDRKEWLDKRFGQITIERSNLVNKIKELTK